MVMLHDVLEHLHDSPRELLIGLLERVRDQGYLYVTVPNIMSTYGNGSRCSEVRPAIRNMSCITGIREGGAGASEYTGDDCVALAQALGLEVVEVRGVHHMLDKVPRRLRRIYLAASRAVPSTRDTWSMVARKLIGWIPKTQLDDEEFRKLTGLKSWSELAH